MIFVKLWFQWIKCRLSPCEGAWEMLQISLSLMNRLNKIVICDFHDHLFYFGLVALEGPTFTRIFMQEKFWQNIKLKIDPFLNACIFIYILYHTIKPNLLEKFGRYTCILYGMVLFRIFKDCIGSLRNNWLNIKD